MALKVLDWLLLDEEIRQILNGITHEESKTNKWLEQTKMNLRRGNEAKINLSYFDNGTVECRFEKIKLSSGTKSSND